MKTLYISVCKNTILHNLKHADNQPPIRVSRGLHGKPMRFHNLEFSGNGRIVYSPNKPAPWGARVWVEVKN